MKTLQKIRDGIDEIDFEILSLLRDRQDLVVSAAQFKHRREGEDGVIVPSRIKNMLEDRAVEAERLGLDVVFIDKLCGLVIDHMIEHEMKKWESNDKSSS
jgi:chorismate mutase